MAVLVAYWTLRVTLAVAGLVGAVSLAAGAGPLDAVVRMAAAAFALTTVGRILVGQLAPGELAPGQIAPPEVPALEREETP